MDMVWMRDVGLSCELLHTDPAVYEKNNKASGPIAWTSVFWRLFSRWLHCHQVA